MRWEIRVQIPEKEHKARGTVAHPDGGRGNAIEQSIQRVFGFLGSNKLIEFNVRGRQ